MRDFQFGDPTHDGDEVRIAVHVPPDLSYFEGHFPEYPIVPGIAQIAPLAEAQARRVWPDLGPIRGIRRLKFMSALGPNDDLVLTLAREGTPPKVRFRIDKGETECSRGALLFASG